MVNDLSLLPPNIQPPLDPGFRPAALANRYFRQRLGEAGVRLIFALERGGAKASTFETRVFAPDHPSAPENLIYAERILKFLLWQRGGCRVYVSGPQDIIAYLQACYTPTGRRSFDYRFMSEQVYERPLEIIGVRPDELPAPNDTGMALGRNLDGCRIGFDLGASDRKVSAVIDGNPVYSEEVIWEPRRQADPEYHYREIMSAIQTAASKMPRVDAIGGSSAGIIIDNRPMVASLFRSVPPQQFHLVHDLFLRIRRELGVPLEVINDGDVTALAGSMSLGQDSILGLAMGSSEAAGYIDPKGHILGWLNELAFAPIDYSPTAPTDDWSGDSGCGSMYLSQQCVFRLAPKVGIDIPRELTDAEKLAFVQEQLETGHPGARQIWQSMGIYLGYALAHYQSFYEIGHVLILGRCTSGSGGTIVIEEARNVLQSEFPEIAGQVQVQLPDEKSRRIGQSIAAASLPVILSREAAK